MSFNTSVKFPNVFLLDQIVGELPLDMYTITIESLLEPAELENPDLKKEFVFDRITLDSKLVENGLNPESSTLIFKEMGSQERRVDIRKFVDMLVSQNVGKDVIVALLMDIGFSDMIITRVFSHIRRE
jgi:hypothetical protein